VSAPQDLSQLTTEQLIDRYTPSIFLPSARTTPQYRASVLAENRRIEAELNSRGIYRTP